MRKANLFKHSGPSVDLALITYAEELSDELANLTAPIEAACWQIDEALSALRKDDAGYRIGTKAERNGGGSYVEGELETAVRRARELCLALTLVRDLEAKWALEDAGQAPDTKPWDHHRPHSRPPLHLI